MNLEKLGVALFLKSVSDKEQIKNHLKSSAKHLLLAGLKSFENLSEATKESDVLKPYKKADVTLQQFDALNKDLIKWLNDQGRTTKESKSVILRQIVGEVLEGISEEQARISESHDDSKDLKIKGLKAVSEVLRKKFLNADAASKKEDSASKNKSDVA